jgi:REP element-mobilizing transposase RayT
MFAEVAVDEARRSASRVAADSELKKSPLQLAEWRVSGEVVLERVSTDPYELSYACLLIPRFKTHLLKGDLVEDLNKWMKLVSQSNGWGLDFLSIRPEYLQWIVRVQPTVSSGRVMQEFRAKTSGKILDNFPLFKNENLSRDFWAPGYLIIVAREPHPPEMVSEFIRLTRQQQEFRPRHVD